MLDNEKFDWIPVVEAATGDILAELHNIQATMDIPILQDILEIQVVLSDDDQWKLFFCTVMAIVQSTIACCVLPPIAPCSRLCTMFSRLTSGYDRIAACASCHLGLISPDDGTTRGLDMNDKFCHWEVGKSLVFDGTYERKARNDSDKQRVVLFIDFERPLRFPINYLNRFMLIAIRLSLPIRQAIRNVKNYRGKNPASAGTDALA